MPSKRSARSSVKTIRPYLFAVGVIVLLLALSSILYRERHSAAIIDATARQRPTYTELYFTDPYRLPTTARSGQQLVLDFTIHNLEAKPLTYTYAVDFTTADGRTSR